MSKLSDNHVTNTLRMIADVEADRKAAIDEISDDISNTDSDDDYQSDCPVFDSFYGQKKIATLHYMKHFDADEFQTLWTSLTYIIQPVWLMGRLHKTTYSVKNSLFMVLFTAKQGGTWDFLATVFNIKPPTFARLVKKFVNLCSEPIFDKLVLELNVNNGMSRLFHASKCFTNYPSAMYATDLTFQQANRPSDSVEEGKGTSVGSTNCMVTKWKFLFYLLGWSFIALIITRGA